MGDSLVSHGHDAGETKYFISKFEEGETVWVKGTKETIWDMGTIIAALAKRDDSTVVVRTKAGREVITRKAFAGEEVPVSKARTGYGDMTAMRFVNEPQILENLRVRSYEDEPYTFLGPVLVAVNPLEELAKQKKIKPGNKRILSTPHPFAVAELALQQMQFAVKRQTEYSDSPVDQTVIVSGESGSGKTVSSKLVLEHLVARSGGGELANAMLASNPITESFGNAKTLRNHNSSRFGKMFRIKYDEEGNGIVGATVGTYLLERSRLTKHELGERNFHVFYELLAGADDKTLDALHLDRGMKYKALLPRTKVEKQRNVNFLEVDKPNYTELISSLKTMGFEGDKLMNLLGSVAAILHLSNIVFDKLDINGNAASKVSDDTRDHLKWASELLGVGEEDFEKVLTELQRKVGAQVITSPVSAANAQELLEGVSKALYARIFEFMIISVNVYINTNHEPDLPTIGVLDIFGFETFQRNDLEQLLINYTNEALQLTFNKQVLEAEASLYEREKLAISEHDKAALDPSQVIDQSNKLCIDLLQGVKIDNPDAKKKAKFFPGILDVIHEQGRVPGPSEKKLVDKLHKTFLKDIHPNYMVIKKKARTEFIIKHYAGKVVYTTGNFLLKNVDNLPKATAELFLSAGKEMTKAIWDAGSKLHSSKKASIVSTFKKQISEMTSDLDKTQCSFIRCLKPNVEMHKKKGWFDRRYITIQLRNLSVPKTADVLKAGLPTRIAYDQLVERYAKIFKDHVKIPDLDNERGVKSFIAALFYAFDTPRSCYKLGLTKVFFKSGDLDKLEEILSAADSWSAAKLDATAEADRERILQKYKSYYIQRRWKVIFATMFAGRQFVKMLEEQRAYKELLRKSATLIQSQLRMFVARKKYRQKLYEKKLEEERIAREKAEAERKERERLAEEARQKELEKQRQIKAFMEARRAKRKQEEAKFKSMMDNFKKTNKAAAEMRELKRQERERREAEERARKEEAERQRLELEKIQKEREEQERLAAEAAEAEREAKRLYDEKLAREQAEKEAERQKKTIEEKDKYIEYMENKLTRDQEKLDEKATMEKVVDEIYKREQRKNNQRFVEEEEEEILEDDNPWFFYDDLDLNEIDNISQDSQDAERINEALQFLDNLADDSDSELDDESDLDSQAEERNYQLAKQADTSITQATFKDYNGPFIVNVHMPKLEQNAVKKRRFLKGSLTTWKQCFAFVYPAYERVLLHHGTNTTMKVQFNSRGNNFPAILKKSETYNKKTNVIHVSGVRLMDKDAPDKDVNRNLIMSFQDSSKRDQFAKLLKNFVPSEDDDLSGISGMESAAFKNGNKEVAAAVPKFKKREDRKDVIREQIYTKFALLNRAVKKGELTREQVQGLLLEQDDDDDDDDLEVGGDN